MLPSFRRTLALLSFQIGIVSAFADGTPPANPGLAAQGTPAYGENTLLVAAADGVITSYQWFEGQSGDTSRPVLETTAPRLFTPPLTATRSYWVRAVNAAGTADSPAIALTIPAPPQYVVAGAGLRAGGALGDGYTVGEAVPVPIAADIQALATNEKTALLLKQDGTLWGIGANASGELGLGDLNPRLSPTLVTDQVRSVSLGREHTLILKTDGTLFACGDNSSAQLGSGDLLDKLSPVPVATGVRAATAGGGFSALIKTDDTLWIRMGTANAGPQPSFDVMLAADVESIAAGRDHLLFLKRDHTLWGYGPNGSGQLGTGNTATPGNPVQIAGGVVSYAAGGLHSAYVLADGTLWATGNNYFGQLGAGDTQSRLTPAQVGAGVSVAAAGYYHTLFRKRDGSLWAMGDNHRAQLGEGLVTVSNRASPVEIATRVTNISASWYTSVLTDDSGRLFGFGSNLHGALRPENLPWRITPSLLSESVVQAVGSLRGSMLLRPEGTLLDTAALVTRPTFNPGVIDTGVARVSPIPSYLDMDTKDPISIGHWLYIKTDASLWGSGLNLSGQLQPGGEAYSQAPLQVAVNVAKAGGGATFTLFLKQDLTLWKSGLFGPGTSAGGSVAQLAQDVIDLKTNYHYAAFLKRDGTLWGVGYDYGGVLGQFGTTYNTPVQLASDVTAFDVGYRHMIFLKSNGELWGRGLNTYGQLGTAGGLRMIDTNVAKLQATAWSTYYLKTNQGLYATGYNVTGTFGNSTFGPVPLPRGRGNAFASAIWASADSQTLFYRSTPDNRLWARGANNFGQLGLDNFTSLVLAAEIPFNVADIVPAGPYTLFLLDPATVTATAPTITAQPASQGFVFGDFATLSVGASGTQSLLYQWYRGAGGDISAPVPYANTATLRLPAFAASGSFWCRVTNLAGSVDSAAASITFAGGGSPAFRAWAEAAGLDGPGLATTADPDGDGLVNLLEFALGRAPAQTDLTPPWQSELAHVTGETLLTLTHRRKKGFEANLGYESSSDLTTWEPVTTTPAIIDPDPDGTGATEEVTIAIPLPPAPESVFLRLKIQEL